MKDLLDLTGRQDHDIGACKNVLFVCSMARLRSPTAERLFGGMPGIQTASAGINRDADNPLTPELVAWADIIFVMEARHRDRLSLLFAEDIGDRPVICLDVPDRYGLMDPNLVRLLRRKAGPMLAAAAGAQSPVRYRRPRTPR